MDINTAIIEYKVLQKERFLIVMIKVSIRLFVDIYFQMEDANEVVPKPKPRATMPNLVNNFLIITNFHLHTTPNSKAETELQTIKLHKSQMRKRFRLEALDISNK